VHGGQELCDLNNNQFELVMDEFGDEGLRFVIVIVAFSICCLHMFVISCLWDYRFYIICIYLASLSLVHARIQKSILCIALLSSCISLSLARLEI
jgi:hypothetical protein